MTNKENLLKINYYNGDKLSSVIWVDYRTNEVEVTNYTDDLVFRAFGVNETPTFDDFEDFSSFAPVRTAAKKADNAPQVRIPSFLKRQ